MLKTVSRPGYEYLTSYQFGLIIQELTEKFTDRWIKSLRRKHQMDESSRSTHQNINIRGY